MKNSQSIKYLKNHPNLLVLNTKNQTVVKGGGFAIADLGFQLSNGFFDIFTE